MTSSRILYAYCRELDAIVSIDTARKYFVSEEPPLDAYHFFCDDPNCAGGTKPVRISGVSYRVPASESAKYVTAHFRHLDDHHQQCHWNIDADSDELWPGESDSDAKQRLLRRKLHDLVTVFDPVLAEDDGLGRPRIRPADPGNDVDNPGRPPRDRNRDDADNLLGGYNRTNQLSRLVETYREARATLAEADFKEFEIRVVNEGVLTLQEYFCHLTRASYKTRNRVIFGGATLIGRYGQGFKFKFYDKVAKTAVYLYVSPGMMAGFRFRKYLELALARAKEVKYFTIYALGTLVAGKSEGNSDLIVDDLRHLALVLGPEGDASAC
jgi:hypothetical protein